MKTITKNRYKKCSGNRTENRAKFPGCGKINYNYIIFIVLINTSARGPTDKKLYWCCLNGKFYNEYKNENSMIYKNVPGFKKSTKPDVITL